MPKAEIIKEIDAYLSRLRQARKLLLDAKTEAPPKSVPDRNTNVTAGQAEPPSSNQPRAEKNKSRSKHPVAHLKRITKRVDASAQVESAVVHHAPHSVEAPIARPESAIDQSVAVTRLPARGRTRSIRPVRHRPMKPAFANKPDEMKPAIARAAPTSARIVVVSAEQVQREREQAARPAVVRPRPSLSGLSGKRAFEALFKD